MNSKRVKGGEKNSISGTRWTKDELSKVLNLYLQIQGKGLHEHNPLIQKLANEIGRTTRSLEAQLLMFRNLDKFGFYGFRNMSTISKQLWKEYIDKSTV